jgi:hypothetical protein
MFALRRIGRVFWSYRQALKASARLGRANKLRKASRPEEALAAAREGLGFLKHPDVIRHNPPEASAIVCLTVTVEQLAHELQQDGASEQDLRESYANLVEFGDSRKSSLRDLRSAWLPYLHRRLGMQGEPPT